MSTEDKTRGCLTKAQTLRASGNYKEAVAALQSLSEHGVQWGPMYIAALDLLAELCFSQEQGITVDRFFPAFKWNRNKLRGSQHLEEGTKRIVEIAMKHLRALGERAHTNAKATGENPLGRGAHPCCPLRGVACTTGEGALPCPCGDRRTISGQRAFKL
ncbi:hypothetical protein TcCL_NonESM05091 [Trypanosoma cruzi]|nr:hypothetical protein TcCL_NonESM05091 [Trypanosoma cruzi]